MFVALPLLNGCATVKKGLYPAPENHPDNRAIYLIYKSNHTGIAFAVNDKTPYLDDIRQAFPGINWLKFNWGDRKWYAGGAKNAVTSTVALLVPTNSALRISSLPSAPETYYTNPKRYNKVMLSSQGFENLLKFIESSFLRTSSGQIQKIHSGKTPTRQYQVFAAKGKYHLLRNSNSWSSQALAVAGVSRSMLQLVVGDID